MFLPVLLAAILGAAPAGAAVVKVCPAFEGLSVRRSLARMALSDQLARRALVLGLPFHDVDAPNTAALKEIITEHGWPTVSKFGPEADRNAWLLAQHADRDVPFQKKVLALLEKLHPLGETSPAHYAYLFDRVAFAEGRPQRYGTQLRGGSPEPLEEPSGVDARRAALGLGPLAEYLKRF